MSKTFRFLKGLSSVAIFVVLGPPAFVCGLTSIGAEYIAEMSWRAFEFFAHSAHGSEIVLEYKLAALEARKAAAVIAYKKAKPGIKFHAFKWGVRFPVCAALSALIAPFAFLAYLGESLGVAVDNVTDWLAGKLEPIHAMHWRLRVDAKYS